MVNRVTNQILSEPRARVWLVRRTVQQRFRLKFVWSETLAKQRVLRAEEQRGHLSVKTSSQMSQSARFLRSVVQGM